VVLTPLWGPLADLPLGYPLSGLLLFWSSPLSFVFWFLLGEAGFDSLTKLLGGLVQRVPPLPGGIVKAFLLPVGVMGIALRSSYRLKYKKILPALWCMAGGPIHLVCGYSFLHLDLW